MNDFEAKALLDEMAAAMIAYDEAQGERDPDEYEMSGECVRWLQSRLAGAAPVEAAKIPAGWKLVPIASTSKMDSAGYETMVHESSQHIDAERCWDAMVAAAPEPEAWDWK